MLTDSKAGHECSRTQLDGWLLQKMSTFSWWSHCSHSAHGVFNNNSRPDKQEGRWTVSVSKVEGLCKHSVFVSPKNKKEAVSTSCLRAFVVCLLKVCSFIPLCLTLMGIFHLNAESSKKSWYVWNHTDYVQQQQMKMRKLAFDLNLHI